MPPAPARLVPATPEDGMSQNWPAGYASTWLAKKRKKTPEASANAVVRFIEVLLSVSAVASRAQRGAGEPALDGGVVRVVRREEVDARVREAADLRLREELAGIGRRDER